MKIAKIITLVLLICFVGIQFITTKQNQNHVVLKTDFLTVNNSPENIRALLQKSCYDCHSNNTNYPWYNKIQPIAWFLENHVEKGKIELNFSEWSLLSNRRKKSKLRSIIKQIESNEMPLKSYIFTHRKAILSEKDKKEIIQYLTILKIN